MKQKIVSGEPVDAQPPDEKLKERIAALERELGESRIREKNLEDLLEKKLTEVYTHYHISRSISSMLDLREMLGEILGIINKKVPFDRTSAFLVDKSGENMDLIYSAGMDLPGKIMLPVGEGTPGRIAENGEHIQIHDLSLFYHTFNDFIHFPGEVKREGSYIGIALKVHDETIGVIGIDSPVKYGLSVDDMDFLSILSYHIAAGMEKCLLFQKIQQLSEVDALTGLYNYRVFQEKLAQELARRPRQNPLSLLMLDIDHFKLINDNHGHQAGDRILKQLARIIVSHSRCSSVDICCRYGGEEFAVILPGLEPQSAVRAAERLRRAIEQTNFAIEDNEAETRLTVSIGVAGVSSGEEISPEKLIKAADVSLYESKKSGRNRVSWNGS